MIETIVNALPQASLESQSGAGSPGVESAASLQQPSGIEAADFARASASAVPEVWAQPTASQGSLSSRFAHGVSNLADQLSALEASVQSTARPAPPPSFPTFDAGDAHAQGTGSQVAGSTMSSAEESMLQAEQKLFEFQRVSTLQIEGLKHVLGDFKTLMKGQ